MASTSGSKAKPGFKVVLAGQLLTLPSLQMVVMERFIIQVSQWESRGDLDLVQYARAHARRHAFKHVHIHKSMQAAQAD